MSVLELNAMLAQSRSDAISKRRQSILTVAQHHRRNARTYSAMGLYSVAAVETIKAANAERAARELTRAVREEMVTL